MGIAHRTARWWIPFLIVALKGIWNLDAYQLGSPAYLIANLALGLAIIPVANLALQKIRDRMDRSPIISV